MTFKNLHNSRLIQNELYSTDDQPTSFRYMALDTEAVSIAGKSLVKAATARVGLVVGKRPLAKLEGAVGAILGDLLITAGRDRGRWAYRSIGAGEFTGLNVGYRPFIDGLTGLQRLRFVDFQLGFYRKSGGRASTIRATDSLIDFANNCGVTLAELDRHFAPRPRPRVIAKPIILRAERKAIYGEERGRKLPVDWSHPKVIEAKQIVDAINAYFAGVRIDGADHRGFKRIYGAGSDPAFDWDMGARLYSLGGGYQNLSQEERSGILLNGEPTVELDVKASHLAVIHARLGLSGSEHDPYDVAGIPRDVVKAWVTMCLGYGKFHQQWSPAASARYAEDFDGRCLEDDYPLLKIRDRLKEALPEIGIALANGLGWARLQYVESCAIIDAVQRLATVHDVPALPVHDSLIVPASKRGLAERVMKECFLRKAGVQISITAKVG